jgi:hypothetical protein
MGACVGESRSLDKEGYPEYSSRAPWDMLLVYLLTRSPKLLCRNWVLRHGRSRFAFQSQKIRVSISALPHAATGSLPACANAMDSMHHAPINVPMAANSGLIANHNNLPSNVNQLDFQPYPHFPVNYNSPQGVLGLDLVCPTL